MTTTARITRWGQPEVSERVVFRETPAWLEAINQEAAALGLNRSDFIRLVLHSHINDRRKGQAQG